MEITQYGFKWKDMLVERICSNDKNPRFRMLRIHCLNGDCVEIISQPRKTKIEVIPNPEKKRKK